MLQGILKSVGKLVEKDANIKEELYKGEVIPGIYALLQL